MVNQPNGAKAACRAVTASFRSPSTRFFRLAERPLAASLAAFADWPFNQAVWSR
jgi:hypothetical protein